MSFFSHRYKSYSRIEVFFLSKSVSQQMIDCKIGLIALSDHAPVETQIDLNAETGRQGKWRMNTMLLNNEVLSEKLAGGTDYVFRIKCRDHREIVLVMGGIQGTYERKINSI